MSLPRRDGLLNSSNDNGELIVVGTTDVVSNNDDDDPDSTPGIVLLRRSMSEPRPKTEKRVFDEKGEPAKTTRMGLKDALSNDPSLWEVASGTDLVSQPALRRLPGSRPSLTDCMKRISLNMITRQLAEISASSSSSTREASPPPEGRHPVLLVDPLPLSLLSHRLSEGSGRRISPRRKASSAVCSLNAIKCFIPLLKASYGYTAARLGELMVRLRRVSVGPLASLRLLNVSHQ